MTGKNRSSSNLNPTEENLSRRDLFKFSIKVGAGLTAFIPAAAVLLQNVSTAFASASSCYCSSITCYNPQLKRTLNEYICNGQYQSCNCLDNKVLG